MKYTALPIEIEAFVITGIGATHSDGSVNVEIDTGETIRDSQGADVPEKEILLAPADSNPAIGDYFIANKEGTPTTCVLKKADFEAHYAREEALVNMPSAEPIPTPEPIAEPAIVPAPEPTAEEV